MNKKKIGSTDTHIYIQDGNTIRIRQKPGVSRARIKRDPAFARLRQNAAEFGRAARYGKKLRRAFTELIIPGADLTLVSRLVKTILEAIKTDTFNDLGTRTLLPSNVGLLNRFEFNAQHSLTTVLTAPIRPAINAEGTKAKVVIDAITPSMHLRCPPGATHYSIKAVAAPIDFEDFWIYPGTKQTGILPIDHKLGQPTILELDLQNPKALPVFLALAIRFYHQDGREYSHIRGGNADPAQIIAVG